MPVDTETAVTIDTTSVGTGYDDLSGGDREPMPPSPGWRVPNVTRRTVSSGITPPSLPSVEWDGRATDD